MMLCRVILGNILKISGTDQKAENRVLGTNYDSLIGISPSWVSMPGAREFLAVFFYDSELERIFSNF